VYTKGGGGGGDGERDLVRGLPKRLQSGLNDGRGALVRPIVCGLKCLLEVAIFHGEALAAPGCVKVAQHPEIELVQNLCVWGGGGGGNRDQADTEMADNERESDIVTERERKHRHCDREREHEERDTKKVR
jgi:hypothetical protein